MGRGATCVCNPRFRYWQHDLNKPLPQLLQKPVNYIINLASASNVEQSTKDPVFYLRNNFEIQLNLLEFARQSMDLELFLQISTDEVYGEAPPEKAHQEWSPILPSNPYAASKANQETMSIAYWRTYGLPLIIVNCQNLIGEKQNPEKFLPKTIRKINLDEEVPIFASAGKIGSRIYLHARNLADALVFLTGVEPVKYLNWNSRPDRYNVCGERELTNLELAQMVAKAMGKELKYQLMSSNSARPGYDRRYALDNSKIHDLGWEPPMTIEESIERIVDYDSNK